MGDKEPLVGKLDARGLPELTEEERATAYSKGKGLVCGLLLVPRVICMGIGVAVYLYGDTAFYNKQIALVTNGRWGYVYVGAGVFSFLVSFLNMFPTAVKAKVMLQESGNLRANMAIYKVAVPAGEKAMPYVVMEEDGPVGEYNRANRSLFHFNENAANVVMNFVFAGFVFSFPAMVCICIFAFGRILHQQGYTTGYGSHGAGFGIAMLSGGTLEALVLITAYKSLSTVTAA